MNEDANGQVWHLIRSKLGEEFLAEAALARLAGEVFLPVLRRIKRRPRGELASAPVPLFSGHLFARLDPVRSQKTIKYALGVRGLVMSGRVPVTVPANIIDLLKQLVAAQDQVQPLVLMGKLTGDKAFVSELESLFVNPFSADERLMILLRVVDMVKGAT